MHWTCFGIFGHVGFHVGCMAPTRNRARFVLGTEEPCRGCPVDVHLAVQQHRRRNLRLCHWSKSSVRRRAPEDPGMAQNQHPTKIQLVDFQHLFAYIHHTVYIMYISKLYAHISIILCVYIYIYLTCIYEYHHVCILYIWFTVCDSYLL